MQSNCECCYSGLRKLASLCHVNCAPFMVESVLWATAAIMPCVSRLIFAGQCSFHGLRTATLKAAMSGSMHRNSFTSCHCCNTRYGSG